MIITVPLTGSGRAQHENINLLFYII